MLDAPNREAGSNLADMGRSAVHDLTGGGAVDQFRRIVPLVERGIRLWDDKAVEAAGFAPLVLRAW